jgi:hypothetical protein
VVGILETHPSLHAIRLRDGTFGQTRCCVGSPRWKSAEQGAHKVNPHCGFTHTHTFPVAYIIVGLQGIRQPGNVRLRTKYVVAVPRQLGIFAIFASVCTFPAVGFCAE